MNYIFDITLNFNDELLNFYEWDDLDYKEFFLKIPIFKVEENTMFDFINSVNVPFPGNRARSARVQGRSLLRQTVPQQTHWRCSRYPRIFSAGLSV